MRRFIARYSPLFILGAVCIVMAVTSASFRDPENLRNVAYRTCVVGIVALGETLVILTAGIDLSVGSVAALSGVVASLLMVDAGWPVVPACIVGTLVGSVCGLVSGAIWAKGKIPPFIATLGMMMVARGATLLVSGAKPIFGLPDSFDYLGGTRGWWIPVSIAAALTVAFASMLGFSRLGRAIYATGGNAQGARLSGIPIDWVRIAAFTLAGSLTGFAGVMLASKVGIGDPNAGVGMELDAIAACVIGGASLMGGEGGCVGSVAGALLMTVLVNFCNLKDIDPYWQKVLVGVLIIVLVFYDTWRKRRAGLLRD